MITWDPLGSSRVSPHPQILNFKVSGLVREHIHRFQGLELDWGVGGVHYSAYRIPDIPCEELEPSQSNFAKVGKFALFPNTPLSRKEFFKIREAVRPLAELMKPFSS